MRPKLLRLPSLALLVAAACLAYAAMRPAAGAAVEVFEPLQILRDLPPQSDTKIEFRVRNTTRRIVRIVGADNRCSSETGCSSTPDLPLALPPGGTGTIRIDFRTRESPYSYRLTFQTDAPEQPSFTVVIQG